VKRGQQEEVVLIISAASERGAWSAEQKLHEGIDNARDNTFAY
jgi:hypothetical protein